MYSKKIHDPITCHFDVWLNNLHNTVGMKLRLELRGIVPCHTRFCAIYAHKRLEIFVSKWSYSLLNHWNINSN